MLAPEEDINQSGQLAWFISWLPATLSGSCRLIKCTKYRNGRKAWFVYKLIDDNRLCHIAQLHSFFFVQWSDYHLAGALGLLRILIFQFSETALQVMFYAPFLSFLLLFLAPQLLVEHYSAKGWLISGTLYLRAKEDFIKKVMELMQFEMEEGDGIDAMLHQNGGGIRNASFFEL
ncbi:hypothetical protein L1987_40320 [Smallanthus sonchifolius]|uniref:Uncharacterized protein n=1 Tax=Smallanthus sonchifolius TaxID=185202 RepID=A0ACB9GU35_9ASTR|nr:hypothetical protein L1987_40320 [Smallanthus sonchifolius]